MEAKDETPNDNECFYDRPGVKVDQIRIGQGVPLGIEKVSKPELGIGGAYGTWGKAYNNSALKDMIERHLGEPLPPQDVMSLADLGFIFRHHTPMLSPKDHRDLEIEVGKRFIQEATNASGWEPSEVDALLVGISSPVMENYTEQIAREAGIREDALKISIHKACDSSVGGLHMVLNPQLPVHKKLGQNLAETLQGKKVLVGGIEGLSRMILMTRDKNALQLFGNAAGLFGVIPGKTMKFLVGKDYEVYDEEGVLAARMYYPHSHKKVEGESLVEVIQTGAHHYHVSGLMHEPENNAAVDMAGPMGMVKLFVRTGVQVVNDVYSAYQALMERVGRTDKSIRVAIVHHANLKINKLKEKHLQREGVFLPMPWVLNEFGNVSAASTMIAFLRQLPFLKSGDHILFDGFGAGTYYDVVAVELG